MTFQTLIDAARLTRLLEQDPSTVVVDCRLRLDDPTAGRRLYLEGHLPGAVHADQDRVLSGPVTETTGRHPLPDRAALARNLGELGLRNGVQVVAYDDQSGAMAARLWWLLRWLGHEQAAVLDGGIQAWVAHGGELETDAAALPPATFNIGQALNHALSVNEVIRGLDQKSLQLVDARSAERFRGDREPLDPVAGHVPGAVNVPATDNLDETGRFLPPDRLRQLYTPLAEGDGDLVCMCGSGISACHTLLALEHAGLPGARLYAGSWSEWIRDPARPVATGD